jgi:rubrerythrin
MSIVESLKRLVDPVQVQREEAERVSLREQPIREAEGDPPTFVCRVCGYVGTDAMFCPTCLAGTMEPAPRIGKHEP